MTERNFEENPVPTPAGDVKPSSTNAILSLILSILGLIGIVPVIGSILGLVFGYNARKEIEASDDLSGEGMAQWGIILGWVGLALVLLACCLVAFAFFLFVIIAESNSGYYGYLPSMLGMLV
ncbi:MAG: DUF4190 domain-containing protein [Chloroflexi bacterium]|jgi:uncharacterized membrane protein|nr:DUF4190 domain-containing protein [Chloroflexota bacterium]